MVVAIVKGVMTTVCEVPEADDEAYVVSLRNVSEDDRDVASLWFLESAKRVCLAGDEIHIASASDLAMIALRWF